jgi:dTDP-4-amino-4,6-dideoxygalactose transaminase
LGSADEAGAAGASPAVLARRDGPSMRMVMQWRCRRSSNASTSGLLSNSAYHAAFAGLPAITPPSRNLHAWHLYVLRLADGAGIERNAFIERMFERGIGCSVHYIPLHLQPYWRDRYALSAQQFPHSQRAYERMASLPLYTRMTDSDVERVAVAVRDVLTA